jgi:hypothetical protein
VLIPATQQAEMGRIIGLRPAQAKAKNEKDWGNGSSGRVLEVLSSKSSTTNSSSKNRFK